MKIKNWFSGIKTGKWYKSKGLIFFVEQINKDMMLGYGFDDEIGWFRGGIKYHTMVVADDDEVEASLLNEAMRRYENSEFIFGFKSDYYNVISPMRFKGGGILGCDYDNRGEFILMLKNPEYQAACVFKNGQWAPSDFSGRPSITQPYIQWFFDEFSNFYYDEIINKDKK